jgi:hypothetical protein
VSYGGKGHRTMVETGKEGFKRCDESLTVMHVMRQLIRGLNPVPISTMLDYLIEN